MSSFEDRSVIHSAMKQHKSQIVWFRRIYMFFSRYMLINSLQQMNLVDIELDLELDEWKVACFVNFWIKYVLLKGNIHYSCTFWKFLNVALWIVGVCLLLLKNWRFIGLITKFIIWELWIFYLFYIFILKTQFFKILKIFIVHMRH